MKCLAENMTFVSESRNEYRNDDGTITVRHRATFLQDGDDRPFTCQLADDLAGCFHKLETYSLDLQLNQYSGKFYPKVTGAVNA